MLPLCSPFLRQTWALGFCAAGLSGESGADPKRREVGWWWGGGIWRQKSRPQLMENRCGREKESEMRRKERRKAKDVCSFEQGWNQSRRVQGVCECVCPAGRCVRLTVCVRVAVEALAGRSAAEVWVAEQSGLSWRVTQAVFCFNVCVRRHDIEKHVDNLTRRRQKEHWPFWLRPLERCLFLGHACSFLEKPQASLHFW